MRIWESGFENNSLSIEWTGTSGSPTVSTTTVRTGQYALKVTPSAGSGVRQGAFYQFAASAGIIFVRVYFFFSAFPSAENRVAVLQSTTGATGTAQQWVTIDNLGVFRGYYNDSINGTTQLGSAATAINLNSWHYIEMHIDRATTTEWRLDGVSLGSTGNLPAANALQLMVGANLAAEAQTTGTWFIDDVAVNNTATSNQISWPGAGRVYHFRPNAAGDVNTFATQTGGTAGSANNFTRVNEITPDDATSSNGSKTLNQEDLLNIDDPPLTTSDTINYVGIGWRYNGAGASANSAATLEIEGQAAGTKAIIAMTAPTGTTWTINANAVPKVYPTLGSTGNFLNPQTAAAWTVAAIKAAQIGYKLTTASTNNIQISTMWLSVDYTPLIDIDTYETSGLIGSGSSATYTHHGIATTNLYGIVFIGVNGTHTISAVTWGGSAMTALDSATNASNSNCFAYGLASPPTGNQTISVTFDSAVTNAYITSVLLTSSASLLLDTTAHANGTSTAVSDSITTLTTDTCIVDAIYDNPTNASGGAVVNGTAQTILTNAGPDAGWHDFGTSWRGAGTNGAYTMNWTDNGSSPNNTHVMVAIKQGAAAVTFRPHLLTLLGIG